MEKLLVERGGQFMVRKSLKTNQTDSKTSYTSISIKGWQQAHLGWLGLVCCHRSRKEEQHWGTLKECILTWLTLNEGNSLHSPKGVDNTSMPRQLDGQGGWGCIFCSHLLWQRSNIKRTRCQTLRTGWTLVRTLSCERKQLVSQMWIGESKPIKLGMEKETYLKIKTLPTAKWT